MPGSNIVQTNSNIGFNGFFVLIVLFVVHIVINKKTLKKAWSNSLIFYIVLFALHILLFFSSDMGDCGRMYADGSIIFSIMAVFWVIFVPIIGHIIRVNRKNKNMTKPFAIPVNENPEMQHNFKNME